MKSSSVRRNETFVKKSAGEGSINGSQQIRLTTVKFWDQPIPEKVQIKMDLAPSMYHSTIGIPSRTPARVSQNSRQRTSSRPSPTTSVHSGVNYGTWTRRPPPRTSASGRDRGHASSCALARKDREERMKMIRDRQKEEQERREAALREADERAQQLLARKLQQRLEKSKEISLREAQRLNAVQERRKILEMADKEKKEALLAKYRAHSENRANFKEKAKPVYAFGSSTPRVLAYLENLHGDQKLYNTKLSSEPLTAEELEAMSQSMTASSYRPGSRSSSALPSAGRRGIPHGSDSPDAHSTPSRTLRSRPQQRDKSNSLPAHKRGTGPLSSVAAGVTDRLSTPKTRPPPPNASMTASLYIKNGSGESSRRGVSGNGKAVNSQENGIMTQSVYAGTPGSTSDRSRNPRRKTPTPRAVSSRNISTKESDSNTQNRSPMRRAVSSKAPLTAKTPNQRPPTNGHVLPRETDAEKKSARRPPIPKRATTPASKKPASESRNDKKAPAASNSQNEKPKKITKPKELVASDSNKAPVGPGGSNSPSPPGTPPDQKRARASEETGISVETKNLPDSEGQSSSDSASMRVTFASDQPPINLPGEPMDTSDNIPVLGNTESTTLVGTNSIKVEVEESILDEEPLNSPPSSQSSPPPASSSDEELPSKVEGDAMTNSFRVAVPTPTGNTAAVKSEEEAKAALAEKRRLAREAREREEEIARAKEEEFRRKEEERIKQEEEEFRRAEAEELKLLEEMRKAEEERLAKAIEEAEKRKIEEEKQREEEEEKRKVEEEKARVEKERLEKEAKEKEEKFKKEQAEREERKKRLSAIMSRTRQGGGVSPSTTATDISSMANAEKQNPIPATLAANRDATPPPQSLIDTLPEEPEKESEKSALNNSASSHISSTFSSSTQSPFSSNSKVVSSPVLAKLANINPTLSNLLQKHKSNPNLAEEQSGQTGSPQTATTTDSSEMNGNHAIERMAISEIHFNNSSTDDTTTETRVSPRPSETSTSRTADLLGLDSSANQSEAEDGKTRVDDSAAHDLMSKSPLDAVEIGSFTDNSNSIGSITSDLKLVGFEEVSDKLSNLTTSDRNGNLDPQVVSSDSEKTELRNGSSGGFENSSSSATNDFVNSVSTNPFGDNFVTAGTRSGSSQSEQSFSSKTPDSSNPVSPDSRIVSSESRPPPLIKSLADELLSLDPLATSISNRGEDHNTLISNGNISSDEEHLRREELRTPGKSADAELNSESFDSFSDESDSQPDTVRLGATSSNTSGGEPHPSGGNMDPLKFHSQEWTSVSSTAF